MPQKPETAEDYRLLLLDVLEWTTDAPLPKRTRDEILREIAPDRIEKWPDR